MTVIFSFLVHPLPLPLFTSGISLVPRTACHLQKGLGGAVGLEMASLEFPQTQVQEFTLGQAKHAGRYSGLLTLGPSVVTGTQLAHEPHFTIRQ